jgi:hypothetical protein
LRDLIRFIDAKVLHSDHLEAHVTELDFANNIVGGEVAKAIARGLVNIRKVGEDEFDRQ